MEEVNIKLKQNRENLSDSSIKTYSSYLKNIYKKVYGEIPIEINKFNDSKLFLKTLEDIEPSKRKSILSALYVLTLDKEYQSKMNQDITHYNTESKSQIKDEKQKNYWLTIDQIEHIYQKEKQVFEHLIKKKVYNQIDLQEMQNYVILALYLLTLPRRSLDYTEMKIKDINESKDNYIDLKKKQFVFNTYKTAKFYGEQREDIPKDLLKILKKWLKINPTEWLLFDCKNSKLTPSKLTKRLNNIFSCKLSTSGLRHIILTEKYKDYIKLKQNLESDLKSMGSSIAQASVYIKTN